VSGRLDHSPGYVLRQMLVDLDIGTNPGGGGLWPVYSSREPGDPDEVITVYDTAGRDLGRGMPDGLRNELYGIQIRIRSATLAGAFAKAWQIAQSLDVLYLRAVLVAGQGYTVRHFARSGPPLAIGIDTPSTNRRLYTLNGLVSMEMR
jgi:hypothetical protein